MSLKEIKQRIASVKNTQKITSAMKLISAAKLRRAQNAIESMHPYRQKLNDMLVNFLSEMQDISTPYSSVRKVGRVAIIAISSNSTLCGSYNATIIRKAKALLEDYRAQGVEAEVFTVGKKIYESLAKAGYECNEALMSQAGNLQYDEVSKVAYNLMEHFATGELDKVEIVYTRFHSAAKHEPVCETYLPIDITNVCTGNSGVAHDYIVEPGVQQLIGHLLPKVIVLRLFMALLDAAASEHGARMMAMQIATDNADDLITELTREYNKGRQQAITNELLDIASGSINQ